MITLIQDITGPHFGSDGMNALGFNTIEHIMTPMMMQQQAEMYASNSPTMKTLFRSAKSNPEYVVGVNNPRVKFKKNTIFEEFDYVAATPTDLVNAGKDAPICVTFKGERNFKLRQGFTIGAWSASLGKNVYGYIDSIEAAPGQMYKVNMRIQTQPGITSFPADVFAVDTSWAELFRGVAFDESDATRGRMWNMSEGTATVGFFRMDFSVTDGSNNGTANKFHVPIFNVETGKYEYAPDPMSAFEAYQYNDCMKKFNNFLYGSPESFVNGAHTMWDPETGQPIFFPKGLNQSIEEGHEFWHSGPDDILNQMANVAATITQLGYQIHYGPKTFVWQTGLGGLNTYQQAISNKANLLSGFIQGFGKDFYKQQGRIKYDEQVIGGVAQDSISGLVIGNQFSGFIDYQGNLHLLVYEPYYDLSTFAKLSPMLDGTRRLGHDFRLIDMSSYPNENGQLIPNLRFLYVNGLDWLEHTVLGSTMRVPKGWSEWANMGKARTSTKGIGYKTWAMSGALHLAETQLTAVIRRS